MFYFALVVVGFLAGITASVAGFGIGSFLIPLIGIPFTREKHNLNCEMPNINPANKKEDEGPKDLFYL